MLGYPPEEACRLPSPSWPDDQLLSAGHTMCACLLVMSSCLAGFLSPGFGSFGRQQSHELHCRNGPQDPLARCRRGENGLIACLPASRRFRFHAVDREGVLAYAADRLYSVVKCHCKRSCRSSMFPAAARPAWPECVLRTRMTRARNVRKCPQILRRRQNHMPHDNDISRRGLLKQVLGTAAAGIAFPHLVSCQKPTVEVQPAPKVQPPRVSANDRIGVGIIGCGRRNGQLVIGKGGQGAPPANARIVAVADLNMRRANAWAKHYKCQGLSGLPRAAGPQGRGRRRLRHARALALPALHPCLPGRQGHLRRTAALAHHPRGARDDPRRSASTSGCSRPASSSGRTPKRARPWN